MAENTLVIKVTVGQESAERCSQGFTVAATALASGVKVILWLTGDATWFAVPGKAEEFTLEHAAALSDLRDQILESGTIKVCTQLIVIIMTIAAIITKIKLFTDPTNYPIH